MNSSKPKDKEKQVRRRIAYRLHEAENQGGRPDVILLHGLGSCAEDWGFQLPALTRTHRVLALDLPGHGRSPTLPFLPTIGHFSRAVMETIAPILAGPAHFVGLSLGGLVALQLAIDYPESLCSLIVVNSFARMQVPARGLGRLLGRLRLLMFAPMSRVGRWVADGLFPEPDQEQLRSLAAARLAANPRRAYLQAALAVARFDARSSLARIECPTLVVAGEEDQTVALSAKRLLSEQIPGAEFVSLPGSGHASPVDAYTIFNQVLLDFLKKVERVPIRSAV